MSQVPVKWVHKNGFWNDDIASHDQNGVPVIELSALREVVEGLRDSERTTALYSCAESEAYHQALNDLLASLGEVGTR